MILGLFVGLITLLLFWWYKRPSRFPPGPRGLPLCGIIPWMTRRPEIKFYQWSQKYGPVMSARVGSKDWVILNSYEAVEEAMVKQGEKFSGRPPNHIFDSHLRGKYYGVLFSSGQIWQKNRKFGENTFRHLGVGKRSFEISVQKEADILVEFIKRNGNATREWQEDITKAIANVICRVIFGRRFEYTDELFIQSTESLSNDPWAAAIFNLAVLFPWTRFLPPVHAVLKLDSSRRTDMERLFSDETEKHKSSLDPNDVRDFIDAFLVEQEREREEIGENKHFSTLQLFAYIWEIFIAGRDTSASTLMWCFLGFLHYPKWQTKIQSEIKNVICEDIPSLSHRDSMPITQAYIEETLRYCTLLTLAPHCATKDAEILGYKIPTGTQVIINVWSVHNDPKDFDKPDEFRPERFLDAKGKLIRSKHVIPFLVGPRHCLGEQLARMEIFIFLTTILRKCTIKEDPNCSNPLPALDDGINGLAYVPKPFNAKFVPVS